MKKVLLSLLFVATVGLMFGQTLSINNFQRNVIKEKGLKSVNLTPNGIKGTGTSNASFENWNSTLVPYGLGEMPNGFIHIDGNAAGHKSTTAQNGTYSIHIESNMAQYAVLGDTESTLYGGMAFAGALVGTSLVQGEPYTAHLLSIDGYIRGSLLNNDTAMMIVETYLGGATSTAVAFGALMWGPADLSASWVPFNLVMEYEDGAPTPDSINIFLTSTGVGIFNGIDFGTLTAGSWVEFDNFTYNVEAPTTPIAAVSPGSWNAGNVYLTQNSVSDLFTLTNTGTGTLTVSNATALSGPWSTTFNAGSVSLANGEQYTFSFTFAPTALGAANQSFVITTNGGNATINLSGSGIQMPAGNMDGGFENNVNDFDLTFTGWVQHDIDLLPTYGFTSVNFTNSGYTGSFIAFNPASTTPAMTSDVEIQAHTGSRFGACFSGVPASPVVNNNDWLITPQSPVLNSGAKVQMYVKSYTDDYGLERYTVNVSTTGTAVANFTKISAGTYAQAPITWTLVEYDLSAYAGQQVYIGIQCLSADAFIFMVDDVVIDNPTDVNSNVAAAISVYPNPANDVVNVANAENANITIVDMIGNVVATVDNASANESINISNLANGTYFVRVNGEVFKFNVVK